MALKEFLKSKTFYKHLALIIGSFFLILFLVFQILKIYTRHGKECSVPKITGLKFQDIENSSEYSDFVIMIMDSVYKKGIDYGTVLTQDPSEGSLVKSGRKIYITIASATGETVSMPNCKDKSIKTAVQSLIDAGLRVGTIMYRTGEISGIVIQQRYKGKDINQGSDIQSGESVDLIVEVNSTTQAVRMPDILGKTESDAEILLWKAGLNTGRKTYEGKEEDGHMRVVSYNPVERYVMIGTSISLNLENDSKSGFNSHIDKFRKETESLEAQQQTPTEEIELYE